MFENLQERLERSFKILKGQGRISEINVSETLKDVRRALLDADVNYKVAKQFTDTVKAKAMGQNVINALKPQELMLSIVRRELIDLMGGEKAPFNIKGQPAVVLMSGLQGSGKTTFSGKLALKMKTTQHRKPLLVACDIYRPAAIDQLKVLGEQIGVPVYSEPECKDALAIAQRGIEYARDNRLDLVIIDTAGRLQNKSNLMDELGKIRRVTEKNLPVDEVLLVLDATTGQNGMTQAKVFAEAIGITGVVLSKLDGSAKGGIVISVQKELGVPVKLVGLGEGPDDLAPFDPEGFVDGILA